MAQQPISADNVSGKLPDRVEKRLHDNFVSEFDYRSDRNRHTTTDILPITYMYPDYYSVGGQWERLNNTAPTVQWVMMNPGSGPGTSVNTDYLEQMKRARAQGFRVMAYISTQYTARPVAEVKAEFATYLDFYPFIEGIFLDEAVNGWSAQAGQEVYYQEIYDWAKENYPKLTITTNPGSITTPAMVSASDMMMTFENSADVYLANNDLDQAHYVNQPREKFWHAIYGIQDETQARAVIAKAKTHHVGHVYLTNLPLSPNPWGALPAEWLWKLQLEEFGFTTKADAHVLTSPDGSKFRLTVWDDGTLSAERI